MAEMIKALLEEDVIYDELNPKYRFFFNSTHCLRLTKATLFVHTLFTILPILYYLPYSLPTIPIYVVVGIACVYGIKKSDALALLPLQIYIVTLFVFSAATLITDPLIVYYWRSDIYEFFNYEGKSSYLFLLLILSNIFMFHLIFTVLLFWQYQVIVYCRDYMIQVKERAEYSKLSVPPSFLNTQINESTPITAKNPNYAVFSLENIEERPDLVNPN
ncbi:unnamed protein product [Bursaphelenchus xylophilus]|uniref:(pine wood nematode) hypothetical protein n=1 Tax=Bursaphelenchus xylophilus TaxID=6326 RepID=A0A1I7RHF3_BURXY|nr:unnamed protein product [Bursaphelenchus xylophilus]CAG9115794.1 unnamed protein product [Bursaphelenchus xylophilus]